MRVLWACLLAIPLFAADVAVAPQSLSFAYQLRSTLTAPNQGLVLASTQPFAYSVSRPTGDGWLIVGNGSNPASASGTGPAFLPIGVDTRAVGAGTYTSTLSVKVGAGTVPVPVKLFVSAAPILWTDQSLIGFDPGFTLATVGLGMTNGGVVVTSSRKTAPWLTVVDRLGSLTIAGNLEGVTALAAGSVEVTGFPPPANNPVTIPVVLLPLGLNGTPAPLAPSPAALTFTGSGSQQVTVAGPVFSALPDARWVTVFQNGQTMTVSVNAAGMAAGTYQSTVTLNAGGVLQALPVTLTIGPPTLVKVVNAASYAEGAIAPGEVVLLGGSNLGPAALAGLTLDANGLVSTTAGGVRVTFDGVPAPMVYASATVVAAVAPYELDGKSASAVQVDFAGQLSNLLTVPVTATAPGIFTADASGTGEAASFKIGDVISIYLTGEGQTNPGGVNGKVTGTPPLPRGAVTATVGGVDAEVVFAGEAPGIVSGVMQVNLRVPIARAGDLPIVVSVGGVPSQVGVMVSIR